MTLPPLLGGTGPAHPNDTVLKLDRSGIVGALGRKTAMPYLRESANDDGQDSQRIAYFRSLIRSQDQALLARDREIEGNLRMLAGQQWDRWHPALERYVDVGAWLRRDGARGQQRIQATVNRLLQWYLITHARLTENPPIVTFVPGPDKQDAELAEVMDILYKNQWRAAGMTGVLDALYGWLIPAGTAYLGSRIDLQKGPMHEVTARASVGMVGPDGQPVLDPYGAPATMDADGVPLGDDYQPVAHMEVRPGVDGTWEPVGLQLFGAPSQVREGQIAVDVLSPFACRGQWGDAPWHQKQWHAKTWFGTAEEVYDRFGVEAVAGASSQDAAALGTNNAIFEMALFGQGWYGAASGDWTSANKHVDLVAKGQLLRVDEVWVAPNHLIPGMEETRESPGGRHIAFTANQVLVDRPREVRYPYTSPLHRFDFVRLPGRPSGTSVQVALNPLQRAHNKAVSQLAEHSNLTTNPIALIDHRSGIDVGQWTNTAGKALSHSSNPGVTPVQYLNPPPIGQAVMDLMNFTQAGIEALGSTRGTDAAAQSQSESGEVRRERRYDGDRYVGPTQRRAAEEIGRMVETWMPLMKLIYTTPRIIREAGEDQIARTILVRPELFEDGDVDVVPDLQSMLPETREERRARLDWMLDHQLLGDTPQDQRRNYLDLVNFPHMSRAVKAGSIDAVTAGQENGALARGEPVPVPPWYDHAVHIAEHLRFMKDRRFLQLDPAIQQAFLAHVQAHEQMAFQMQQPTTPTPNGPPTRPPASPAEPPEAPRPMQPGRAA